MSGPFPPQLSVFRVLEVVDWTRFRSTETDIDGDLMNEDGVGLFFPSSGRAVFSVADPSSGAEEHPGKVFGRAVIRCICLSDDTINAMRRVHKPRHEYSALASSAGRTTSKHEGRFWQSRRFTRPAMSTENRTCFESFSWRLLRECDRLIGWFKAAHL